MSDPNLPNGEPENEVRIGDVGYFDRRVDSYNPPAHFYPISDYITAIIRGIVS